MSIRYKGKTEIGMLPGYPKYHFGAEESTGVVVLGGKFKELEAAVPKYGSLFPGVRSSMRVLDVDLEPTVGGLGRMTINFTTRLNMGGSGEVAPTQYTLELDWQAIDQPIEQHPMFRSLTDEQLAQIELWEGLGVEFSAQKTAFHYPRVDSPNKLKAEDWGTLSSLQIKLCQKKRKGMASYYTSAPIARRTSTWQKLPPRTLIARQATADVPAAVRVPNYDFIKTVDRSTRDGKSGPWLRVEEWQGGEAIDQEIYPPVGA